MVKHYNPSISESTLKLFNTKSGDHIPSDVLPFITPVMEIFPFNSKIVSATLLNSASSTIYTTPADKDFYLTSVTLGVTKDGTSTSTFSAVNVIVDGLTNAVISIPSLTLTAQTGNNSVTFFKPIKLDRNTAITITNSTATANIRSGCTIVGYELV